MYSLYATDLKFTDGKLINIANSKHHSAKCTAKSEYDNYWNCFNALEPRWQNWKGWASKCAFADCAKQWIKIIFKKRYDIIDICMNQRNHDNFKKPATTNLYFDNGQELIAILNPHTTCILLPETIGKAVLAIRFQAGNENPTMRNIGFNSILVFAYDDEVVKDDLLYTNVAFHSLGATCTSSLGICLNAINQHLIKGWVVTCPLVNGTGQCQGQYINITLAFPTKPEFGCLSVT
ncbi:DgyrCDS14880 [Dimorphilus gyrociliatus]|uniref:DgyrCDS14880 n=1 Tax=Dimorphilus gyrociliatus TaxID=2664684 RepID=A0A7I8WFE5_9ANNE|nr:DgyrCDS14880 [Dimorphilus gyrociliatus]